jgi:hypothetical protein
VTEPKALAVYNLKFEWPDEKMKIGPYVFVPADGYCDRYRRLQHLVNVGGGYCGSTQATTGGHQVTGTVHLPDEMSPAALGWGHDKPTALDDILLLVSIFTGRQVFALDPSIAGGPIIADPRKFQYGGGVGLSLGKVTRRDEFGADDYALNLSVGTSAVLERMRGDAWRSKYGDGRFLFLFAAACHRQILESSFLLCWAIWEHLFRLDHEHWLSRETLKRMNPREKVRFILTEYGLRNRISEEDAKSVDRLTLVRHALVHDGAFEKDEDAGAADLFVRLTEFVIAKILGLEPSGVFSPLERLAAFGRGQLL